MNVNRLCRDEPMAQRKTQLEISGMSNSLAFINYDPHDEYTFLPLRPFKRLLG